MHVVSVTRSVRFVTKLIMIAMVSLTKGTSARTMKFVYRGNVVVHARAMSALTTARDVIAKTKSV